MIRNTATAVRVGTNCIGTNHRAVEQLRHFVPVPRGIFARACGTHTRFGYGYRHERPAELTEVPGTVMNVVQSSSQKFFVGSTPKGKSQSEYPGCGPVCTRQNATPKKNKKELVM